jgi:hypothetical protein
MAVVVVDWLCTSEGTVNMAAVKAKVVTTHPIVVFFILTHLLTRNHQGAPPAHPARASLIG